MEGANIFVLRLNVMRTQVTITARFLPGFTLANSSHLIKPLIVQFNANASKVG